MGDPLAFSLVLNYNGCHLLKRFLYTIVETNYPNHKIVLVDNASTDESVSFVKKNFPNIILLENKTNFGWARGNNVGIKYALDQGADYIVLLNNDIEVYAPWLSCAVKVAESNPRIGMVGFNVIGELKKEPEADFKKAKVNWTELMVEPAKFIAGCALFVRAELFRDIGLVDEVFFAFGEDQDLENRAVKGGYQMVRINLPMWHYGGGSWGKRALAASMLDIRNKIRSKIKDKGILMGFFEFLKLANICCNPFVKIDLTWDHHRRLRPSNPIVNFFLLIYGLGWNLIHLFQTLSIKRSDEKKIMQTRTKLKSYKVERVIRTQS